MPAFTTHNIFAKKVYKEMPLDTKKKIKSSLPIYEMFSQSFDLLYYFHGFSKEKNKEMHKLGSQAHRSNTQLYLINIIRDIKKRKLTKNSDALAYLYGSINHYTLDSIAHPYIFYKTGCYIKGENDTLKYNGLHAKMEYDLDAAIYEEYEKKQYRKFKPILYAPKVEWSSELSDLVNDVFHKTFHKDNIAKSMQKGYKSLRKFLKYVCYDKFGIKYIFYKIIDLINYKKVGKIEYYSNHRSFDYTFMNYSNDEWKHPSLRNSSFNYSFNELMTIAKDKSLELIIITNKFFDNKADEIELIKHFENISYLTGLNISKNKKMQYFAN